MSRNTSLQRLTNLVVVVAVLCGLGETPACSATTVTDDGATSSSSTSTTDSSSTSPLAKARSLKVPYVSAVTKGESENIDFWYQHEKLLDQAWIEWYERQEQQDLLPSLNLDMIDTNLMNAINDLWDEPTLEKENSYVKYYWNQPIPGVYESPEGLNFMTRDGIQKLRQHLTLQKQAGIPIRRPNGMNRYGVVLDNESPGGISYPIVDDFLDDLIDRIFRPTLRKLYPGYFGTEEDDDDIMKYAFTIQYHAGDSSNSASTTKTTFSSRDIYLPKHTDASLFTISININLPEETLYNNSTTLYLEAPDKNHEFVTFEPGKVIIHRGLHPHGVLPIQQGSRHQLIIWLFGPEGYVRFEPYPKEKQIKSIKQRWNNKRNGIKEGTDDANDIGNADASEEDFWNMVAGGDIEAN